MRVVIFVSRNKDNVHIDGFKQRKKTFLTNLEPHDYELAEKFSKFAKAGCPNELSRFYISVNERDNKKVHLALSHFLLDHPDYDLTKLNGKLAGLAARKENALEHKWLFDYDGPIGKFNEFQGDLFSENNFSKDAIESTYATVSGFHIVVKHGFDTRALMSRWGDYVDLKKDDMVLIHWTQNLEESAWD